MTAPDTTLPDTRPAALYRDHLQTLDAALVDALERAAAKGLALEGVVLHSGRHAVYHADDHLIPFHSTPHFARYAPLGGPEHLVLARPGETPRVVRVTPPDFWYDNAPPPRSFWEDAVDLQEAESFEEAIGLLGTLGEVAYVGPSAEAAGQLGIAAERVEPEALMAPLDWARAVKTPHEIDCLRRAVPAVARGYRAAEKAFLGGGSERDIFRAYLAASDQLEHDLPYEAIVALDAKSAILHYQHKRGAEAAPGSVLLVDAGGAHQGYAIDITRTWTRPGTDDTFVALVQGVDALERELVAMVTPGRSYVDIHVETHRATARLLAELGIFKVGAEEAFDRGLTRIFLPHGVGHHLGLQVHDVGGHQATPDGGQAPPPEEYPFLRNTRLLEPGHVVTIEPGIYFIPMLLEPLRQGADRDALDWALIDRLTPLGGVRIEDDVVCTDGAPDDLTRAAVPGPRGPVA